MQKACIVIPCYNEAQRLDLSAFSVFLSAHPYISFLFVNDGSKDDTLKLLKDFSAQHPNKVNYLDLEVNSGKSEAVRLGLLNAIENGFSIVGFWDADLATPLEEIPEFMTKMETLNKKMVIGSRWKRLGAKIDRKPSRHILGRIFSTFASIILKLPVYDTQCGAKLFDASLKDLFTQKFNTKWLFDIEIIARYRNKAGMDSAFNDILELPVSQWIEKGGSKLKMSHMLKVPIELFGIHKRYN